ncbi:PAS domain-containing protein [Coraliomargarita parva]|uniref:PAS domain-containing protein n=1 Tax=Coraliomargarita parva TaxID=3014050 RepID=UPI0022B31F08|nr:PAS domain-containing protein [Coraliomargarita parva]
MSSLKQLNKLPWQAECHAVLLDMRIGRSLVRETIQTIGESQGTVALLCLCRNHKELLNYQEWIHLVDDYLLLESMDDGELLTRISHAIRRRKKEYELIHEQTLLQSLMDNIPDAIYFKDLESRFTKVNRAMAESYGFDRISILGMTDFDLFTEEHARAAYEDEQAIIRTGKPIIGKVEKETYRDGHVTWVTTSKVPLCDNNGRIIGTMGISRSITDMKQVQDTLDKERILLRTILNNVPDRIFVKDREGRYIVSNHRHRRFLQATSDDTVIGKTVYDYFDKEDADILHNEDMHIVRSGIGLINSEEQQINDDGSLAWFLTSKVPLVDENGDTIGLVGIARDVTDQKNTEVKLRSTINILNDTRLQLIESEKLKTVGRLAAGVAHEVKNPLGVVRLGVDYLRGRLKERREFKELLTDMLQATDKANEVIMELLDYSSPHKISMDPMDINTLIRKVLALLRHNFKEAGIHITEDMLKMPLVVMTDTTKLEQVFINLFLNAIAAMPNGGEICIRTERQRMNHTGSNVSGEMTERFKIGDRLVVVEIEDSGHGIKQADKDKLFEPFFSTRATGDGTGLGLSVTRSIVEMHHGMITLENCPKHTGACARAIFPEYTGSTNESSPHSPSSKSSRH